MFGLNAASLWIVVGVILVIIEIFTPGFLFLSFGAGAILTGIFSIFIPNIIVQIIFFALVTFMLFINLRKFGNKVYNKSNPPTNYEALIDKRGVVTETIPEDERGFVKVQGEIWSAVSVDNQKINPNERVLVKKVEGNKLIVKPLEEK